MEAQGGEGRATSCVRGSDLLLCIKTRYARHLDLCKPACARNHPPKGWLRLVGFLKLYISFAEFGLF